MNKILTWSSKTLAFLSAGLLVMVFMTIGMSFTPVEEEENIEENDTTRVIRKSHWQVEDVCGTTDNNQKDYARSSAITMGHGTVKIENTTKVGSLTSIQTQTSTSTAGNEAVITWDCNGNKDAHTNSFKLTATPDDGYFFAGWSTTNTKNDGTSTDNPYTTTITIPYGGWSASQETAYESASTPFTTKIYGYFARITYADVVFLASPSGCSYKITTSGTETVSTSNLTKTSISLATLSAPTASSGYVFAGWYMIDTDGNLMDLSANSTYTVRFSGNCSVGARFVSKGIPQYKNTTTGVTYYGLKAALVAAKGGQAVIPVTDCILDGADLLPQENATYIIPVGVTLLIPYSSANKNQTTPDIVNAEDAITPYRKLTFEEGINIDCRGNICIGGQIMSAAGGKPSGYTTGACGMLDMSRGGHIELQEGASLYAWGFVKGQDMDQGNNTVGVGTITANPGSTVWENLAFGDWRGGSACLDISDTRFFPFQSYFPQNVEVPLSIKHGATDKCYSVVTASSSDWPVSAAIIGKSEALFKTTDGNSLVRKWYDPTTDLICYELSGTANIDAITVSGLPVIGSISSSEFDLPISSNMHIILTNSSITLSKPMIMQPGSKVEIKSDANITLNTNLYIYDKDDWGAYAGYTDKTAYYFRNYGYAYGIFTSHKDRGNGTSKDLLDDAQIIVDGTLTIAASGRLYSTAGGADIMGNGGGQVKFPATLSSSAKIDAFTGNGDEVSGGVAVNTANLHNEDESYTKSTASTKFYNVHGRWFKEGKQTPTANHTYDFTYIASGAVSGTGGTNCSPDPTPAVYSWDKTGLEPRMKWANVTVDGCENWWQGQGEQAGWYYNYTMLSAWHQFKPTETEGLYSCSNNTLYTKTDCTFDPLGETDINCLYEIGGAKKALVDGKFLELAPNNNDPAYHLSSDASRYFICFGGCNWHEATKIEDAFKAYTVSENDYIWHNGEWMQAERELPFFFTYNSENVKVYYEFSEGEWIIATPYVKVVDALNTRYLFTFHEAAKVASTMKNVTITILRDIPNATISAEYTGVNTTCTLDLNGHTVSGSISYLLTVNASSSTFNITDNSSGGKGKLSLAFSANDSRCYALYVKNGTVIFEKGTIEVTNTLIYNKTSAPKPLAGGVNVDAGKTFTMNGGTLSVQSAYNPIGINIGGSASANATVNINSGSTINVASTTIDSPYGIYGYGTLNFNGGTMNVVSEKSTKAIGIYVLAYYKTSTNNYVGTLNLKGGTITVKSQTGNATGIQVSRALAYDSSEPRKITAQYLAKANITGSELNVLTATKTTASGIISHGTVDFSGGTINVTPATTTAFGVRLYAGETKIRGNAVLNVTATSIAYGVRVSEEAPSTAGTVYNGTLTMSGGKITVNATSTTDAYGVYVGGSTLANTTKNASNAKSFAGNYASAGTANISGGEIDVTAKTTKAYDIFVDESKTESGASDYASATSTPKCNITGGKYKLQSLTGATTDVATTNTAATTANYKISAGYYDNSVNLENYAVSPMHAVALPETDANYPEYTYKVAESYNVTFKNGDEVLQSSYQEVGKTPVYNGDAPTKASTTTTSYIFDGWSTTDGGAVVSPLPNVTSAGATYYAHYTETTLKYTVTFDAKTNGGSEEAKVIYVEPSAAVGTLPTATKEGHTFSGWFTAATDGTKITTATVPTGDVTYYAQFTVNNYTLTYELGEGKVTTKGTPIPAKNKTGTQSSSVAYGTALTAPVVARTGYTFAGWSPLIAATMPAVAQTYTPQWTPNTNTAYTVKHYLQNVDGTYPTDPTETEALTGTTGESVTPAVKFYDGFTSPATQTKAIAADGSMVIEYQYSRMHYTITLDATTNGGISEQPTIEVIHGATIGTVPPDAEKGCNDFTGWYTKPAGGVKITSDFNIEYNLKTIYAQFSSELRKYTITYNAGANGTGTVAGV